MLWYGEHSAGLWGAQCWAMGSTVLGYEEQSVGVRGAQCWVGSTVLGFGEQSAGLERKKERIERKIVYFLNTALTYRSHRQASKHGIAIFKHT